MRTGVSFEGDEAVAVCFDDLKPVLSQPLEKIRRAITGGKFGKNHIARDFVPKASSEVIIHRKTNGYSRKCSVIKLNKLPISLKTRIENGKNDYLPYTTSKPALYTATKVRRIETSPKQHSVTSSVVVEDLDDTTVVVEDLDDTTFTVAADIPQSDGMPR